MAFDPNYPVTNSTPWNTLYAGLRSQFTELYAFLSNSQNWTNLTLQSGWAINIANEEYEGRYMKDGLGMVWINGWLKATGSPPTAYPFQLPSGYRPAKNVYFPIFSDSSDGLYSMNDYAYIDVNGYCYASATFANGDEVRFQNHCFPTW